MIRRRTVRETVMTVMGVRMRKMVKLVKCEHAWEIRMFEHGEDRDGSMMVPREDSERFHDGERFHDSSMTVPVTNQEANLVDVKSKSRFEESGGE